MLKRSLIRAVDLTLGTALRGCAIWATVVLGGSLWALQRLPREDAS